MLIVHHGDHPGTTGRHLAEAADRLGLGGGLPETHRRHVELPALRASSYLWVESSVFSLPLRPHRAPFPTAGYIIDVHQHLETSMQQALLFDMVFVAQRDAVPTIRSANPNTHWLPLAAPSAFLGLERDVELPVAFVGHAPQGSRREAILRAVQRRVRLNDWNRAYTTDEMGDTYRRSSLVLNPPLDGDLNMRFFEGLACGAALLTERIANGQDVIGKDGIDFLTADFSTPEGVATAVLEALGRDDLAAVGRRGRALVAARHTYEHRIREVHQRLSTCAMTAPIRTMTARARTQTWMSLLSYYQDRIILSTALRDDPWVIAESPAMVLRPVRAVARRELIDMGRRCVAAAAARVRSRT